MAYFDKYGVEFTDDRKTLVSCPEYLDDEYIVPDGVTCIGESAFRNCTSLSSIMIPNSVTGIGSSAFYGCSSLTSVTLNSNSIVGGSYLFSSSSNIPSKFGSQVKVYILGDEITSIGDYAFKGCDASSINIPDSVTSIGDHAFEYCSGLISIEIPNSVTKIGNYSFLGCWNLESIIIPDSVTSVGAHAFNGCRRLTSIDLPNSITHIGHHAFWGCCGLTSVTIPNSVTSIGEDTFNFCDKLKVIYISKGDRAHYLPMNGLKSLNNLIMEIDKDGYAVDEFGVVFSHDCETLISCPKDFIGEYTIPKFTNTIANGAFQGCDKLNAITVPDSVTSIGDFAFAECRNLLYVELGINVTDIGRGAFEKCFRLKSINLPHGTKTIGNKAFWGTDLKSIIIPNSVIEIGDEVFAHCGKLKEVFFLCKNGAVDVGESLFEGSGIFEGSIIHVPLSYQEQLSEFEVQFRYFHIEESIEAEVLFLKDIIETYFLSPNSRSFLNKERLYVPIAASNMEELRATIVRYYLHIIEKHFSSEEIIENKTILFNSEDICITVSGLEIPNEIYQVFRDEHVDLPEYLWCSSGKDIFEKMREQAGLRIGLYAPRFGFYKVKETIYEDGEKYLMCLYNVRNANYFVDEVVKVKQSIFYNKYSSGDKDQQIEIGDIIHVSQPTRLKEDKDKNGETYKTYSLIWRFKKHTFRRKMSTRDIEDLRYAMAEEQFWNDYQAKLNGED